MLGLFSEAAGGGRFGAGGGRDGDHRVDALDPTSARLLWAVRRLALMQPIGAARCHAVHIALQQEFGDAGMGVEHLLRCILVGLSRVAERRLAIGEPGCGLVTGDEAALLALIDGTGGESMLVGLAGSTSATPLLPLFAAVTALVQNNCITDFTK